MQMVGWEPFTGPVLYLDCGVNSFLSVPCSEKGSAELGREKMEVGRSRHLGPRQQEKQFC